MCYKYVLRVVDGDQELWALRDGVWYMLWVEDEVE